MGFYDGPSIVTNGLILSLDAADKNSYVGSGTTWNDLTGNNSSISLVNSPTFGSANGGTIIFDGTNDYAELTTRNTALEFQPTQPFSVFSWFKSPSAASSIGAIVSNMTGSGTIAGWDLWFNNPSTANTVAMHFISVWPANAMKVRVDYNYTTYLNQWVYLGYTYNGSSPSNSETTLTSVNFYLNGSLITSGKAIAETADGFNSTSETITYNINQRFRVASRWQSGTWNAGSNLSGSAVQVYNRVLSANEVLQNYEAQKSRFGL
jgi:hypothetical protein